LPLSVFSVFSAVKNSPQVFHAIRVGNCPLAH
jgi:hypothetical protein